MNKPAPTIRRDTDIRLEEKNRRWEKDAESRCCLFFGGGRRFACPMPIHIESWTHPMVITCRRQAVLNNIAMLVYRNHDLLGIDLTSARMELQGHLYHTVLR